MRSNRLFPFCLILLLLITGLKAQIPTNNPRPIVQLKRTQEAIILDGNVDEKAWYTGTEATKFWQYFPFDTLAAHGETEIFMTYDDDYLYVAVKCYGTSSDYIIPSLRRDYDFFGNDNITLLFDTYNDQTNAFVFGMNPFGVRREALISNGGREFSAFADSWDNKWRGEAGIHEGYWAAEFAIPFKSIRFTNGGTKWRFNCYRFDTEFNEVTTWIPIPRNQLIMDLGYMGEMHWDEPLRKTGKNFSLIPYTIGGLSRNFEDAEQTRPEGSFNFGGDAKVALTSGLNLDLTGNPDFSQVEVDQQVTNLDRFEIFFPERRQFFLENADLFGRFGLTRVNPFFSRRIGVAIDTATGQNIQNPILFGARLSGKLNDKLRVGLLNMQTASEEENGLPGFNFTVAAVEQQVFKRSNLAFMMVNKQATRPEEFGGDFQPYNRVAGLEYRIGTPDNSWGGKVFYHHAFTPSDDPHKFTHGLQIEHLKRRYRFEWAHLFIGQGFDAEVGFVPRRDFMLLSPEAQVFFYPSKGAFAQHSVGFDYRQIYKPGADGNTVLEPWSLSDRQLELTWEFSLKNNTRGSVQATYNHLVLFNDFDPTRIQEDGIFLGAGNDYTYSDISGSYMSDLRKRLSFSVMPSFGQFFNGYRAGVGGSINYRFQPYGFISMTYNYNYIDLPDPFQTANLWLVGPRLDLTFSKNIFLTTFVQYNSQFDNLNINARFQWRFQPVSDFFIVYTDNYLVDPTSNFAVRNRAIVAKLTYWLNL